MYKWEPNYLIVVVCELYFTYTLPRSLCKRTKLTDNQSKLTDNRIYASLIEKLLLKYYAVHNNN